MRCAHPSLVVATLTVLACSSGERRHATSAADSVFTPRQYSVADFYRNTSYFGASFSPNGGSDPRQLQCLGRLQRLRDPDRRWRARAAHQIRPMTPSSPSPGSRRTIESSTPATGAATSWTICTCACPTAARRTSRRGRSTRRSSPGGPATTARSSSAPTSATPGSSISTSTPPTATAGSSSTATPRAIPSARSPATSATSRWCARGPRTTPTSSCTIERPARRR